MNRKYDAKKENEIKVQTNSSSLLADECGQGMVEYGLIIGLIALVAVGVLSAMGHNLYDLFFGKIRGTITTLTQNPQ